MNKTKILLSICTRCRDGREHIYETRGGARLAEKFMKYAGEHNSLALRGVHCMSQCKRPCVVSFAGAEHFTYSFGDLDPECSQHVRALQEFAELFQNAPEGFVLRSERPKVLRAGILGRYPPIKTNSDLVLNLTEKSFDKG